LVLRDTVAMPANNRLSRFRSAQARGVTATTLNAPRASAAQIDVEKVAGATPIVSIAGGEIALWPKLALSGIEGKVVANPKHAGEYVIDLAGGYGGVPGRLWTARGGLDPGALGSFHLRGGVLLDDPAVAQGALQTVLRRDADQVDRRQDRSKTSCRSDGRECWHAILGPCRR
jgi:hypothetical protein